MARIEPDRLLLPSVLDRLIDDDPGAASDTRRSRGQFLSDLRRSVRRDIETLLNSRRRCVSWPAGLEQLERSLVNYGIPDFSGANLASEGQRELFCRVIEEALRRHEQRFQRVSVTMVEGEDPIERTLRFRIEALVHAEPTPEPLIADTVLDPVTRAFSVLNTDHG